VQLASRADTPLRSTLSHREPGERDKLESLHTLLMTLAWEWRHYNAVNGKVIDRSRQSVAELARTLSGTNADSTYTARGIQRAYSNGVPITHD